jgi:predicted nucleic acid-binding protein
MIVLDASVAIEWLLQTSKAVAIEARLFSEATPLRWHAPHLLDVEVAQVLRKQVATGAISDTRGREALQDVLDLPLVRYPHDFLLPRVWELRRNLTGYDAVYVALAEVLGCALVTCDAKIAGAPGPADAGVAHVTVRQPHDCPIHRAHPPPPRRRDLLLRSRPVRL